MNYLPFQIFECEYYRLLVRSFLSVDLILGTMPAIFGLTCANIVLMSLADYPVPQQFPAASKLRHRLYADVHGNIKSQSDPFGSSTTQPNCPFSVDDVGYIIEEVFRGRSILEPFHTTRLTLVKWRAEGTFEWNNVICVTKAEGKEHEMKILKGNEKVEDIYGMEVVSRVDEIWKEEKAMRGVRWGNMYTSKS